MSLRIDKVNSLLRNIVSSFVGREFKDGIIITVTRVETSSDLRKAKIFVSVFPDNKSDDTLKLLQKKSWDLKKYAQPLLKMKFLPEFDFEIDYGEKNRQRLEEIVQKENIS